jgi:hypothetical protein
MNKELLMVLVPALSWLLFALGGTEISKKIKGQKWIRRFVLPIVYLVAGIIAGVKLGQAIGVAVLACGAFHLGYGERKDWIDRIGVGLAYGLIGIPIGISVWNLITVLGFLVLFKLSNTKLTANMFVWKIVEGMIGLLIGIEVAYSLMGLGITW